MLVAGDDEQEAAREIAIAIQEYLDVEIDAGEDADLHGETREVEVTV